MRIAFLALALVGCGKPADLGRWDACWRDDEVRKSAAGDPETGSLLWLQARWGEVPFTYDTGAMADLALFLPASPQVGDSVTLGGRLASYREGGMVGTFFSETVLGVARIDDVRPDLVVVRIDAQATEPSVDVDGWGSVELHGTVRAPRAASGGCSR